MLYAGTTRRNNLAEIHVFDTGSDGRLLTSLWSLKIDAHANALATEGSRLYVATSANDSELVIIDTVIPAVIGRFDAGGVADATAIEIVAPGEVVLSRRRGPGPETYRLDVSDPARVVVLEAEEDPRGTRPSKPAKIEGFVHFGRLKARLDRETTRGSLHYLAVTDRDAEIQVVERQVPVVFEDVNGDGIYRLGCVGDSNTVHLATRAGWCERLRARIGDPDFEVVNVAVAGATVTPNLLFDSDATQQMEEVLLHAPDAVVLAFGTNDVFQGRSALAIHDAYLAQEATSQQAGIAFYVATTPPIGTCPCPAIGLGNMMLHETFGDRALEFNDGFTSEYFGPDGYHLSELGRELRAERAFAMFANPFVYEVP